jgi:hypothetical protein
MTRPLHQAFVEERVDDCGAVYFVACCLVTRKRCDALLFVVPDSRISPWWVGALSYLGNRPLHVNYGHTPESLCFCDAEHVHV